MNYLARFRKLIVNLAAILSAAIVISCPTNALTATSLTPASGVVDGGNTVTIKGSGFMASETEKFQDVVAGVEHAVMLSNNGHVWTVGRNSEGQLGIGTLEQYKTTPQDITSRFELDSDDQIIYISSGDYYSFAISANHRVFAWGRNTKGQLGDGTLNSRNQPVEITNNFELKAGDYITSIAAGVETTYAVSNNGESFIWGDASDKQHGKIEERTEAWITPRLATNWMSDGMQQIAVGNKSAISMTARGYIFTWGRNTSGELGRSKAGEANNISSAAGTYMIQGNFDLEDGDEITDIEAGNGVMAALTKYHRVFIWGGDQLGMLGLGGEIPNPNDGKTGNDVSSAPIDITDLFELPDDDCIAQISIGNSHVMAVSQYGQVFSWGQANYGQLGLGDNIAQPTITNMTAMFELGEEGLTIQKVVAAGSADSAVASYSYALDSDGNVYGWGGSAKGLPGINMLTNTSSPNVISDRLVTKVADVAEIRFGEESAIFTVKSDETIKAIAPVADVAGAVTVTITNRSGEASELAQAYTYIAASDDGDSDDDDDNDGASDNNNSTDNSSDNSSSDSSNNSSTNSSTSTANGSSKSSTSSSSSTKVSAPNTGCR